MQKHRNALILHWPILLDQLYKQISEIDSLHPEEKNCTPSYSAQADLVADTVICSIEDAAETEAKCQQLLCKSTAEHLVFDLTIDKDAFTATVRQTNGTSPSATIRVYQVDIEVLFSTNPFMTGADQTKRFSYLVPTAQFAVSFAAGESTSSTQPSLKSAATFNLSKGS